MKTTRQISDSHLTLNSFKLRTLVASVSLVTAISIQAAEIEKEFLLNAEVSHQSNPRFNATNRQSVTTYRVAPEFNMNVATELDRFYLKSLLSIFRNSNEETLPDRENPTITAGWEKTLASGVFGLEAYYNEDVALINQLNTLGNATGTQVNNEMKTRRVSAKFDHDFNSRLSIKNTASYTNVDFSAISQGLVDYQATEANSRLLYHTSETLAPYVQLGFLHYDPDTTGPNGKLSRLRFGVVTNPLDGLDIDANIGPYHTSGFDSSGGLETQVLGTYNRERINYNFSASRLITARGINQFQETSAYLLGAKYLITELRAVGAEYSNSLNQTSNQADIRLQSLMAYYEHGFKDWRVRATARLMELDNGIARSNSEIGVSLIYGPLNF